MHLKSTYELWKIATWQIAPFETIKYHGMASRRKTPPPHTHPPTNICKQQLKFLLKKKPCLPELSHVAFIWGETYHCFLNQGAKSTEIGVDTVSFPATLSNQSGKQRIGKPDSLSNQISKYFYFKKQNDSAVYIVVYIVRANNRKYLKVAKFIARTYLFQENNNTNKYLHL